MGKKAFSKDAYQLLHQSGHIDPPAELVEQVADDHVEPGQQRELGLGLALPTA